MEKVHKKSALMSRAKEQLAELIMTLEHNNNVLHETLDTQAANYIKLTSWVPVSERLPVDGEMVLVSCVTKKGVSSVNRAYHSGGTWHGSGSMSGVVAWMPLPEPYKVD